ncbi:hypothetical protein GCK72_016330 [Caenorhabditis remanei]|uniref:Glycolipid transfer protein domain-containing protein n=2 Tax=Caenorhabditis remanei TaxID=31234 RepID=E3N5U5_CAERE|nr:hypothetical protein GCK72_016330 [Caenorhabditis remanei]EFO87368.1 hypothetical protein CRE_31418 [Caenorhabditis remanei]KAF1759863.1 hypothetical protein GCK72_016330 [Caenorhabditis remanei]
MGQCLCKSSTASDPYHPLDEQLFTTKTIELMRASAGQIVPEESSGIKFLYIGAINDLFNTVNGLYVKLEEVDKLQKDGKSIEKPIRAFLKALKVIGKFYDTFLRLSDFKIDEFVQVRKDEACGGYIHWFVMKEEMKTLEKEKPFDVEGLKGSVDHQFGVAQKLFHKL